MSCNTRELATCDGCKKEKSVTREYLRFNDVKTGDETEGFIIVKTCDSCRLQLSEVAQDAMAQAKAVSTFRPTGGRPDNRYGP